jgi:hypothetical protein
VDVPVVDSAAKQAAEARHRVVPLEGVARVQAVRADSREPVVATLETRADSREPVVATLETRADSREPVAATQALGTARPAGGMPEMPEEATLRRACVLLRNR